MSGNRKSIEWHSDAHLKAILCMASVAAIRPNLSKAAPLARKLDAFVALSDAELSVLEGLHKRRRTVVAGRDLAHQGQSDQAAYILISGWACQ
jgi:CRP-like cAMP-binding protein